MDGSGHRTPPIQRRNFPQALIIRRLNEGDLLPWNGKVEPDLSGFCIDDFTLDISFVPLIPEGHGGYFCGGTVDSVIVVKGIKSVEFFPELRQMVKVFALEGSAEDGVKGLNMAVFLWGVGMGKGLHEVVILKEFAEFLGAKLGSIVASDFDMGLPGPGFPRFEMFLNHPGPGLLHLRLSHVKAHFPMQDHPGKDINQGQDKAIPT
jgi:hypothetical protein